MAICLGGMVAAFAPTKRDLTATVGARRWPRAPPPPILRGPPVSPMYSTCVYFCLMRSGAPLRVLCGLMAPDCSQMPSPGVCCMVKKQNKVGGARELLHHAQPRCNIGSQLGLVVLWSEGVVLAKVEIAIKHDKGG